MAKKPKYGDVYREPADGALWMYLAALNVTEPELPHATLSLTAATILDANTDTNMDITAEETTIGYCETDGLGDLVDD